MFSVDHIFESLKKPNYKGNFTYIGFLRQDAPLFIILGFFCAFAFYIVSYMKDKTLTNISTNNLGNILIADPPGLFIQISLISSFIIIVLIAWVILAEIVGYNDIEDMKHRKKSEVNQGQDLKNNIYDEAISALKRYFFVFLFYALIFYDISYLIFSYIPSLKPLIVITSVTLQLFLIYKIEMEILKDKQADISVYTKTLTYRVESIMLILISIASILFLILNPNPNYVFLFFMFPLLLALALAYFAIKEITSILPEAVYEQLGASRKKEMRPVSIGAFLLCALMILLVFNLLANNVTNNDSIAGCWYCLHEDYQFTFYNNGSFCWSHGLEKTPGYWVKSDETSYKILFEDGRTPPELDNRTVIAYDRDFIYALNDTGFWLKRGAP